MDVYTYYVIYVSALTWKLELSFFDGGTFVAGEGKQFQEIDVQITNKKNSYIPIIRWMAPFSNPSLRLSVYFLNTDIE